MSESPSGFPSIAVPDKEKDKDYHLRWARSIVSNNFTNGWSTNYQILKTLYSFFLDGTQGDMTTYLQTAPDGSQMPGIWLSLNNGRVKLTNLIGELEERGYMIKAKALNSEAIHRKFEEKERLRIERHLQDVFEFAEQESGMPLKSGEYVPQTDQELDEYMDLTWKDKHVVILETALKWIAQRTDWDEKRKALFRDVLISNRAIVKNEIIRGIPQGRRVDPLKFIFDPNSSDDMLSDSTYFGEVEYMPLAVAAERYSLSLDDLKKAQGDYQDYLGLGLDARGSHSEAASFGYMPGQMLKWFKIEDGTPRCLVIKACWRDYKTLSHKYEKKEEYGAEYFQDLTGNEKELSRDRNKDKITTNKIECWRQATIIGGSILKEWGECPNQARDLSKLEISEPPYKVWIPDFLVGKSVSKLEQLVGLQLMKDIAMYQIQIQMARAVGKVLVFDEAMMPSGMSKEDVTARIKADGIAWVNSKEYQMTAGNMNLFKDFDLSMSESILQAINIIEYCDSQMDSISGVNSERTGGVQGASTAVGVQQAQLIQSNLNTAPYFKGFDRFCSRVFNHQAKLVKVAWAGREVFAPIIGDVGVDFLKDNIEIQLDEFDVFVQSLPPFTQDRQKLEQMLMIAVQSDPEMLDDALDIMMEPDTTVALRKFKRKRALRKMMLQQQEQAQMQAEQEFQQQQLEQQGQLQQGNWQNLKDIQQMKGDNNLQKTRVTSRTKLNSEKLRLLGK
jgi:hypothetical protein